MKSMKSFMNFPFQDFPDCCLLMLAWYSGLLVSNNELPGLKILRFSGSWDATIRVWDAVEAR